MTKFARTLFVWGMAGMMGLACSALWAARPQVEGGPPVNAGMAGSWANAGIPGQGLFIDVDPSSRTVFLAWFTYAEMPSESESTIGSASNRWYVALGTYAEGSSVVELTLIETDGGVFDQGDPVSETEVGTLTLRFSGCEAAEMEFVFNGSGHQGIIELTRLTTAEICESLVDA